VFHRKQNKTNHDCRVPTTNYMRRESDAWHSFRFVQKNRRGILEKHLKAKTNYRNGNLNSERIFWLKQLYCCNFFIHA